MKKRIRQRQRPSCHRCNGRHHHHHHHHPLRWLLLLLVGASTLLLSSSTSVVTAQVPPIVMEDEQHEQHEKNSKNNDEMMLLRDWYSQQQQPSVAAPGTKRQALYQYSLDLHYQDTLQDAVLLMQHQQQQQQQQQDQSEGDSSLPEQEQQQEQHSSILIQSIRNVYATFRQSITSRKHQESTATTGKSTTNNMNHVQSRPFADDDSPTRFGDRSTSLAASFPPFPISLKESNRALLQEMFTASYDAYLYHAFLVNDSTGKNAQIAGEVKPLTCRPGRFDLIQLPALTVVDALDTLLVMGNVTEFARAVERLRTLHTSAMESGKSGGLFDVDINVSLFETNIRMLGGLLSAHQMALAFIAHPNTNNNNNHDDKDKKTKKLAKPVLLDAVFMPDGQTVRNGRLEHELEQQTATCSCSSRTSDSSSNSDHDELEAPLQNGNNNRRFMSVCDNGALSLQDCAVMTNTPSASATGDADTDGTCDIKKKPLLNTTATRRQLRRTLLLSRQQALQQQQQQQLDDEMVQYWHYDGFLLDLAIDLGNRFLPAFETKTGIPYGTIHLQHGVPHGETTVASLAGAGSLSLEMELLSRLSGNAVYGRVAKRATRALWQRQYSMTGLVGKHIEVKNGAWTETLSGIGSNSDSFYEYLVKHYMLFGVNDKSNGVGNAGAGGDKDFWIMLLTAYTGIYKNLRVGEWYTDGDMHTQQQQPPHQQQQHAANNGSRRTIFESLMAFYPGMQILLGQVIPAARTLNSFFLVREFLGFLPERFHFGHWRKDGGMSGAGRHPLRPELLESCYFLHRATQQEQQRTSSSSMSSSSSFSGWLWAADFALQKLERTTKAKCGYAGLNDVKPTTTGLVNSTDEQNRGNIEYMNEMPSFFLSETIKYLYLTFDDENILHLDADDRQWIFTTEAHPIHHVPAGSSSSSNANQADGGNNNNNDRFSWDVHNLKKILQSRIHHEHHHGHGARNSTSVSNRSIDRRRAATRKQQDRSLSQELWSEATTLSDFNGMVSSMVDLVSGLRQKQKENRDNINGSPGGVFVDFENDLESIVPHEHIVMDAWKDAANHRNMAHLGWRALGSGDGTYLRKACPNVHASDWLWMNALHGGSMDYTDVYSSVTNDHFSQHVNGFAVLGASEALGFHGSGVYLGEFDTPGCPLVANDKSAGPESKRRKAAEQPSSSSSSFSQQEETPDSTELKTDLGTFQVAASPGGSGFSVRLKETGQAIHATMLTDGDDSTETLVLVHSSTPVKADTSEGVAATQVSASSSATSGSGEFSSWWSQFLSASISDFTEDRPVRTSDEQVRVADFEGNVFSCEVEIVAKKGQASETDEDSSIVLGRVPCTPALFGPSKVSNLAQSGDLVIEASLSPPLEQDLYGCNPTPVEEQRCPPAEVSAAEVSWKGVTEDSKDDSSTCYAEETSCPNRIIQFVHRGGCSFGTKVANQKNSLNADVVVVINTQEEELFVMSGGANDLGISEDDLPLAVLVAGLDGEELLRVAANTEMQDGSGPSNHDSHIVARVSLKRHSVKNFDASESGDGEIVSFPMVQANPHLLRVFAQGGWGVQALRQTQDERTNWQVQLMRHELDVVIEDESHDK